MDWAQPTSLSKINLNLCSTINHLRNKRGTPSTALHALSRQIQQLIKGGVRIISFRKANKREVKKYEETINE